MLSKLPIIICCFLFISCSKENFPDYNKIATFEDLQESISKYSASPDSRNINWDSLANVYRPLISQDLSETEYFELIGRLLRSFRDPHIWLISPTESMYTIDYLDYKMNYNDSLVFTYYIPDLESHTEAIKSGFVNDSIGYLACKDFKGEKSFNNETYITVLEKFKNTKGLIIDLRFNDGGSVYNAQNLLEKFTTQRVLWHTTQNRTVDGFDEKHEWYINPDPQITYTKDVILLTGRYTISAGERFTIGAQLLENMTIVGDTTSNTQGSVMGREMLNGWQYTFTFEKCLTPDGVNYAGKGIPPDFYIDSENSISNNRDFLIEKAIELLD